MKKVLRRGMPFSPDVAPLVSRMPVVDEHREALLRLQGVWDSLAMLGQMSGTLPDIAATRTAFESLGEKLLDALARSLLHNVQLRLRSQGQVAIDILVRNLFERTADIGFLATDTALRDFLQSGADESLRPALEARFAEYAAKYTVYDDIVVLSPEGRVLARLDRSCTATATTGTQAPWLAEALSGNVPYVEHYGHSQLLGGRQALVYATGIRGPQQVLGVLCLSFRFDDEMQGVFGQLLPAGDPNVITLVDPAGTVLASSDPWQVPRGAQLASAAGDGSALMQRFAGRHYLASTLAASGYEGYHGPGWRARVMVPLDQAFEDHDGADERFAADSLAQVDTRGLFGPELRDIPQQARHIQRDLSRVLWNGKLRTIDRSGTAGSTSAAFTATLLREVGATGDRIRQVFDRAIGNLRQAALAAVFDQARHHARLAIDIMDRNLYERANDCRWWALDGVLRATLAQPAGERDARPATEVLKRINGLYTAYSLLVLFDAEGCIVAVSDPAESARVGQPLEAAWVRETLQLRDAQGYAVSRHTPSGLYGNRPTYVYAGAVRAPASSQVVGGIAIVFDGAPQLKAMLHDAQPADTAAGLFVTRSGCVVASGAWRWAVGGAAPALPGLAALARGQAATAVLQIDGTAYAAGYAVSGGYREYLSGQAASADDVVAVMLVPLGPVTDGTETAPISAPDVTQTASTAHTLPVASFLCDGQWLGLPAGAALQALHLPRIAGIPNAPAHVLGMTMHDGRLIPVVDLGALRGGQPGESDAPVIVVQGDGGERLGLRVDDLGPVFDIAPDDIQSLQHSVTNGHADRLVRSAGQMLVLVNVAHLLNAAGLTALTHHPATRTVAA